MKKRITAALAAALLLCSCGAADSSASADEKHSTSVFAMDTYMTLTAYGGDAEAALTAASEAITDLESRISVTAEGSEIYALDHAGSAELSEETRELVQFGLDMNARTGGALDITLYPVTSAWGFTKEEHRVPSDSELLELLALTGPDKLSLEGNTATLKEGSMIDLGAIGKGYAGDLAVKALKDRGVTSAILDLGGNIQTLGTKPDGSKWSIGIRDPFEGGLFGTLSVGEAAVVTSGAYERFFEQDGVLYWHILDPEDGRPADSGVASSTIVGSEGRLCDALSTAVFVMGHDRAFDLWRRSGDFEYIIVTNERQVFVSEGLADAFEPDAAYAESVTVDRR
ncbi:MAG: FAD:protein FMN transferase [Ruminococcus sp.]|nr:FAD:protein FMN transferase [Ruminococcus sp.]